jgi:hypothetical protein
MVSLLASLALAVAAPVPRERSDAEFLKAVGAAREKAVRFLKDKQEADGGWEGLAQPGFSDAKGWTTGLVVLGLLEAGVPADDPAVAKAVAFLHPLQPDRTYVVGLRTRALARADAKKSAKAIQAGADWLTAKAIRADEKFKGWGSQDAIADSFSTHAAITGLHAAAQAGAKVDPDIWPQIRDYLTGVQFEDGGWGYGSLTYPASGHAPTLKGLLGLTVAAKYDTRTKFPDPVFERGMDLLLTGRLDERGADKVPDLTWVVTADLGRTLGVSEFRSGKLAKAWYRAKAEKLVKDQQFDGSWKSGDARTDGKAPVAATACGLYFLGPPKK